MVLIVSTCEVKVGSCASVNNDKIHLVETSYHLRSLAGHNVTTLVIVINLKHLSNDSDITIKCKTCTNITQGS